MGAQKRIQQMDDGTGKIRLKSPTNAKKSEIGG